MTRLILTAAVLLAGGFALAQDKVEGTYTLKSAMQSGKAAPPAFTEAVKEVKFTAAEMVFVTTDGKEQKDAIKVDAKAGTIDITAGGKTRQGLFKMDKDELTVVIGAADGKRPTDFKGEGDGVRLLVLTKKK